MAIYRNPKFTFAGTDISTQLQSLAFNQSAEEQDDTAFGDTVRSSAGGLTRWTFEGVGHQSFGTTTKFDDAFATRIGNTGAVLFRPYASSTGTVDKTNPKYTGTGLLTEYNPAGGEVGTQWTAPFSIVSAGTLDRATST